ncbi:MAG: hypothetical protein WBO74_18690 [Thermoanaerobaculia bacterium]
MEAVFATSGLRHDYVPDQQVSSRFDVALEVVRHNVVQLGTVSLQLGIQVLRYFEHALSRRAVVLAGAPT